MSRMNEIQINLYREDHFHPEIHWLGWKQFSEKCYYYILATAKLADSFVQKLPITFLVNSTFNFFQLLGKDPLFKQFLKIIGRGFTIEESHIFNNLIDISSYPWALLILKECIILRISWSLNEIDGKLVLIAGINTRGNILSLETRVYWDAKKALELILFSLKFDIGLLMIKVGGIIGEFFPLYWVLSIDQYGLALVKVI